MTYVIGEALAVLRTLESDRFQCCVTSPPYWGLRDYDHPEQIGLESTPEAYVARLVEIMREVRRVLRPDGVLWLNLGDSYVAGGAGEQGQTGQTADRSVAKQRGRVMTTKDPKHAGRDREGGRPNRNLVGGLKPKDLVGIPWMVAFALRADGWWLRQDNIWSKPAPMPDPTKDRTTRAHEYVFQLTRSYAYFYDAAAISEPAVSAARAGNKARKSRAEHGGIKDDNRHQKTGVPWTDVGGRRNCRSVWSIAARPYKGSHFAVMPPALAERCILAGSRPGDEVLDPFLGSGTVGAVAEALGRRWLGIDLQPAYEPLIKERTAQQGLLTRAGGAA